MSMELPRNQRRQSHRFSLGEAIPGALELADRSRLPVLLVDQSAGGFAVLIDGPPPIGRGDLAKLRTDSFCAEIRVASLTELGPGDKDANASASAPRFRVGLLRLGDAEETEHGRQWFPWLLFLPAVKLSKFALFLVVLFVPVIAMTVFFIFLFTLTSQSNSAHSPQDAVRSAGQAHSKRNTLSDAGEAADGATGRTPISRTRVEPRPEDLKHLPGASPFVTTTVISDLRLSNTQLQKIRRILDETDTAIREDPECRLLLDAARQEVLNLLDDRQRRRWEAISGGDKMPKEFP